MSFAADLERANIPFSAEADPFAAVHADATDRALANSVATRLEKKLGDILEDFFRSTASAETLLKGSSAPLAGLAARIKACHALALINDHELHDCELINRIGNEIGRAATTNFASDSVAHLCRKLHFRDRRHACAPRDNFSYAAAALLSRLSSRPFYVSGEKRFRRNWPI
jgi:DNA-binding MltR family transcriptional regulator